MELRDDVVALRRFTASDTPAVAAACADPDIARFIPGIPVPYSETDAQAYIAMTEELWRERSRLAFAIADASTGTLLGAIDVRLGDIGSIGYWTAPEARKRGIATRALRLLSTWAVTEGGVERLELTTHPANLASQRVAEKAGFQREGVLRSHLRFRDGRRDSVLFSLLPSDVD